MKISVLLRFMRRYYRWLLLLLPLPLLMLAAALFAVHSQGIRVHGLVWRGGVPELARWHWQQHGCVRARGERLRITRLQPLRLSMRSLTILPCPGREELKPPPHTPPFDLSVEAFSIRGSPPAAVTIQQRQQRWHIQARYRHSQLQAEYDRASGRWHAHGQVQAADLAPTLLGTLALSGQGRWLEQRLDGTLQAQGRQLGHRAQPQRGDATLAARFAAKQWGLSASQNAPLALGAGWHLQAGETLRASGDFNGLRALHLNLRAAGPHGTLRLNLNTQGVAHGDGRLVLSGPQLKGTVPLRWRLNTLELAPATLQLPSELRVSWPHPLLLPLGLLGQSKISAELQQRQLKLRTVDSVLSWQQGRWSWQGKLQLSGRAGGHHISGAWQGRASPAGLAGAPATIKLQRPQLTLTLRIPVAELRAPHWRTRAQISGHYGAAPLSGVLNTSYARGRWHGTLNGSGRLPQYQRGGAFQLSAPWYGQNGQWMLARGSRASIAEGVLGTTLLKPAALTASSPLRMDGNGLFGTLQLQGQGLQTTRWAMPAAHGQLQLSGRHASGQLQVPAWNSTLRLTATPGQRGGLHGTLALSTPLSAAISRGLPFKLQQGRLEAQGQWQWEKRLRVQGRLNASEVELDWGGILVAGGNGAARINIEQQRVALTSLGPITLGALDLGLLLRNVSARVHTPNLSQWHFGNAYAEALGGQLRAGELQWPSSQYQAIAVSGIDLAALVAARKDPNPTVRLAGRVGGTLPLLWQQKTPAIQAGRMHNEGALALELNAPASLLKLGQSNQAVQLALSTLRHLQIHDLQARLDMKPDGGLNAVVAIKGVSPEQGNHPIALNYTHQENVLELLRSLRIGDEISRRILARQQAEDTR